MPPELHTKDDIPLYELGDSTLEMINIFNEEASRGFVDRFSREVNSRTFLARTGDMTWDEVAELEHARTGSLQDYQMAFNVATYAKDLGFTREFIEDSPADYIQEHVAELIAGGRQKMFDVVFDVLKNGVADGSTLWYTPEDHGAKSFTNTHDHTYTGLNTDATDTSNTLFGDAASRSPTEIAATAARDLTEHGYQPDTILTTEEMADKFIEERTDGFGSNFYVPQAENLEAASIPRSEENIRVRGMDVMSTAWLDAGEFEAGEHPLYVYDSSQVPIARHTVRAMELTDNTGAPVGGAGGFRGDPGALLGAYGTMRFGTKNTDPLTGVVVEGIDLAEITTS